MIRITIAGCVVLIVAAIAEQFLEERDLKLLVDPKETVQLPGADVRYHWTGRDRAGPTVVLVHGVDGCLEQWTLEQQEISKFAPVISYDRGGQCLSNFSSAFDGAMQADEMVAMLDALGVAWPVVLVSNSMGASLIRITAARYPTRVAGLVLVAPYLPEIEGRVPGRHAPFRAFIRWIGLHCLRSLFGLSRLKRYVVEPIFGALGSEAATPQDNAASVRFRHWWRLLRELFRDRATSAEVMSGHVRGDLPLILLEETEAGPVSADPLYIELHRTLVNTTTRGEVRTFSPKDHHSLLWEPEQVPVIVGAIRSVVDGVRGDQK